MSRVRAEIEIDESPEQVFAFFDDVDNAAVLVPSLVAVTKVEPLAGGGRHVEYTTRNRHGEIVEATSDHLDHDPPRRTVTRTVQSGIETTSTREFVATTGGATRVVATVQWSVPVRYVGGVVSLPLRGPLKRALGRSLAAAKAAIEAQATE